ncbi:MAG: MipA/OmpV family protein [Bdellovibrionales bacterium]
MKLVIFFLSFFCGHAFAEEPINMDDLKPMPLWELGVGGGGTYTPDYPGSNQNHLWAIPFPFAVYRGEILHSDRRGGTRARFFHNAGYEFNFSASGGLPSSSTSNVAREGMPNLEWLGELGPRLMVDIYAKPERALLRFGLPLRVAFSSNFQHLTDRGYTIAPELLYDLPHIFGSRFDVFTLLTVNFADRRFNSYFYGVEPKDARPGRQAYEARGGYLLTDLSAGLITNFVNDRIKINTYFTVQSLDGMSNSASPLYKQPYNYTMSMVLIWVFAKSEDRVKAED